VRQLSIKKKLTIVIMTVTAVALLFISVGFVAYELITVQQRMRQDLSAQSRMIADLAAPALNHGNVADAEKILAALAEREHIKAAAIYSGNKLFARYPANALGATFPPAPESGEYSHFDFKAGNLVFFHSINAGAAPTGAIYFKSDLGEIKEQMERYGAFLSGSFLRRRASRIFFQSGCKKAFPSRLFSSQKLRAQ